MRDPFRDPSASGQRAQPADATARALFLDRDGIINIDHGYVHRPERTELVPGIFELVASARELGYLPIVVTNQAGIGRGLYTEQEFLAYTAWLHQQFRDQGAPLVATYYCPHHPIAGRGEFLVRCTCRKPAPGMFLRAISDYSLDARTSAMIGDKESDIEAARAAGVESVLLASSKDVKDISLARLAGIKGGK
ncbi:HAD family hydrolase [Lysobacter sp. S4-A87]|uniref:D-glycero-alpha-D-manno-heptose-1,7-bisphosphate 7-phosphatase n=1 Tax=Lysobacter sp. S4-A87 TaxID=2925843 RepID=UPI001F53DC45|nr:HAD family hydrolase [Lysobacter sp. S4-A87]UNK48884.1 HAD family hydrolase [Lysobacter sp. S4-A87]